MSATTNPFSDYTPNARAANAEQAAALDAMRTRQLAGKVPTVFLPFGKQEPLSKYVGMKVVPFQRNPFIDKPEKILKEPDPSAHYGFAKRDDPLVRGKLRSGRYEPVYLDEVIDTNDAPITVEEVLTERGPCKIVLWHGLQMIKIPRQTWIEDYEQPALMGSVRLTQHQQSFMDFSMRGVERTTSVDAEGVVTETQTAGASFSDLRGKAELEFKIEA